MLKLLLWLIGLMNIINLEEGKDYPSYCSGIVYFGYSDDHKYGIKILNDDQSKLLGLRYWYMPRTVTNSPFMYTRVWYRK